MFTNSTLSAVGRFRAVASTVVHILYEDPSSLSDADRTKIGIGRRFLEIIDRGRYLMEHPAHIPTMEEEDSVLAYRFALRTLRLYRCADWFRDDLLRDMEVLRLLIESQVPIPANDIQLTRSFFERIRVCTAEFLARSSCVSTDITEDVSTRIVGGQHHC